MNYPHSHKYPKSLNMTGKKFNKLTIIEHQAPKKGNRFVLCKCECGNVTSVRLNRLTYGSTKSCGCLQIKTAIKNQKKAALKNRKHGMSNTNIYSIWKNMMNRCHKKDNPNYVNYGGRGIKVCNRWKDIKKFYIDMGEPPNKKYSLERIDNNGNYCKENCRWATPLEQARNTRRNIIVTYNGKKMCFSKFVQENKLSYIKAIYRYKKNYSLVQIMEESRLV